jgi:GDPmannose 4,6-dehydratase
MKFFSVKVEENMTKPLIIEKIGQEGAYLAGFFLEKIYSIFGIMRRSASPDTLLERLKWLGIVEKVCLLDGDITDLSCLTRCIQDIQPDEVCNLAAQSFVRTSWTQPLFTGTVNALGAHNVLEACRIAAPKAKIYQASSSEMFGLVRERQQNEQAAFHPRSPYGVSKLYAHWIAINYRESFGMHASGGILFNHESPLRGREFVTRKITDGVVRIKLNQTSELRLGNLDACRDWGHARDYVRAMWLMLQQDRPDDYVIASGQTTSVREFCRMAFAYVGLNYHDFVHVDERFHRPAELDVLLGDATKARQQLGWSPEITLQEMIAEMVEADLYRLRNDVAQHQAPLRRGSGH